LLLIHKMERNSFQPGVDWGTVPVNAKEITTSIAMVSKVAAIVNLFRDEFPKLRTDLAPWQQDEVTKEYIDPDSVDIGFHFPGRSPTCQCRSILVQVCVHYDAHQHPQRVSKIELAGYDHRGQCWWFSTTGGWQFLGSTIPETTQRDILRRLCCQICNLFLDATDPLVNVGLSQTALCEYFDFEESMIRAIATHVGLDVLTYLQHLTGWQLRQERFFPSSPEMDTTDGSLR
jgi:hypothetical protein